MTPTEFKEWLEKIEAKLDAVIAARAVETRSCFSRFARLEVYVLLLTGVVGSFLSWFFLK